MRINAVSETINQQDTEVGFCHSCICLYLVLGDSGGTEGKGGQGRETCMHKSKRGCCGYTVRVASNGPPDATHAPGSQRQL